MTDGDFPSRESVSTATGVGKVANPPSGGGEHPQQLHTGKVGYGPNYHTGPTLSDKLIGVKEEIIGALKKDHELKQHGHDLRTGELKRRQEAESEPQQGVPTEGDEPGKRVGEGRADTNNP